MPNTPAQLGRGITVWYATPEVSTAQREQARVLLASLGMQLEVDDEKLVAMATAVSGTGPTYVFLVMEALIDAAVHLGFPRHVAHDLVVETLEGSTRFAKSSGMHPAQLRNMVTSPGGTSAAALHELEWAVCGPSSQRRSGQPSGGPRSWAATWRRTRRRPTSAGAGGRSGPYDPRRPGTRRISSARCERTALFLTACLAVVGCRAASETSPAADTPLPVLTVSLPSPTHSPAPDVEGAGVANTRRLTVADAASTAVTDAIPRAAPSRTAARHPTASTAGRVRSRGLARVRRGHSSCSARRCRSKGRGRSAEMRYFSGPDVPWILEPHYAVVEYWYVRAALVDDPSFQAPLAARAANRRNTGISAVARFDSVGYQSPDWTGFVGEGEPTSYPGLPGQWSGIPYDFVTGDGDSGQPGLPDEVVGCLSGT